ncbi:hypothetical protein KDV41_09785 [Providencia stuartii]|uniref:hypothetical protein n=1 Tax=Providencia TaxID=586 RepID=UPI0018CBC837|nr:MULTISPECIES: hypothetical protein [Providencia]QPN41883.1 hypothetical protein I3B46_07185 [Providencia sp. 2.29]MBQ0456844.1 hypothetical protein [Providencia stuartii]MBQ0692796.1 hypothetical protein [Providencia stuartii]WAZ77406.1 hypothetical protein O4001_14300 [Providencia stuartii]WAZ81448.1 hypothetical protein O4002_13710 [Providencia stuartii]
MEEIVLKSSEAENVLREWFEAGIAYNLIFGSLDFRKQSGLVHLRRLLARIPLSNRPYYYDILEKAFDPRYDALHVVMRNLNLTSPLNCQFFAYVDILTKNYPNMSLELFLTAAATTYSVLEPKKIVHAYYKVRTELNSIERHRQDIIIKDPTLIALYKMVNERQLTSNLVKVVYGHPQNNMAQFRIHACDLFTNKLDNSEFNLGQIHAHFIEIAHKLALGQDPLKDVLHPLLDGKRYTQWAPILHALCRYYEDITPAKYYKIYREEFPREYDHELDSKKIAPQFKRLNRRLFSLYRFIKPYPDDFAKVTQPLLKKMDPAVVRKMVICHMVMFYFSVMKNSTWYIKVRECMTKLKKIYPQDYQFKLLTFSENDGHIDDLLFNNLKELFHSNPVGLFPWMFLGSLPEPMELMKHYFSNKNSDNIECIAERNLFFKKLNLASSVLMIPMFLNNFDSSQWMKPNIMVQLPSGNTNTCIFYTPTNISKEDSLYLAGVFCKGQYLQETLEENLTMEISALEDLLLGICFLWYNLFVDKTSVSKFIGILQANEINEISERALKVRINKAKNWLKQWPRISLFHEKF